MGLRMSLTSSRFGVASAAVLMSPLCLERGPTDAWPLSTLSPLASAYFLWWCEARLL